MTRFPETDSRNHHANSDIASKNMVCSESVFSDVEYKLITSRLHYDCFITKKHQHLWFMFETLSGMYAFKMSFYFVVRRLYQFDKYERYHRSNR